MKETQTIQAKQSGEGFPERFKNLKNKGLSNRLTKQVLIKKVGIKKTEDKEIEIKHIWRLKNQLYKRLLQDISKNLETSPWVNRDLQK